ncbi:hypothetical protein AMECASPLE_003268 [Ameca splendens]|uniref:Uncharacterized protein n=1 Tax=Ameca splendens TaxID=208324 RepID=A0ABV0XYC8_9TELE
MFADACCTFTPNNSSSRWINETSAKASQNALSTDGSRFWKSHPPAMGHTSASAIQFCPLTLTLCGCCRCCCIPFLSVYISAAVTVTARIWVLCPRDECVYVPESKTALSKKFSVDALAFSKWNKFR